MVGLIPPRMRLIAAFVRRGLGVTIRDRTSHRSSAQCRRHDPFRQQHDDGHEDEAQRHVDVEAAVAAQYRRQILQRDRAQDRSGERAQTADNHPDDGLRHHRQAKYVRADECVPVGEQAPGVAGDARADDEQRQFDGRGVVADQAGPDLVMADRDGDATERRTRAAS